MDDKLINAACNEGRMGVGGGRIKELTKKDRKRHGGMAFIIFHRYLCMKWKTITSCEFFIRHPIH